MALPLIGTALGLVGDLAGNWMKGKVDKQKAESDVKVAKAKQKQLCIKNKQLVK